MTQTRRAAAGTIALAALFLAGSVLAGSVLAGSVLGGSALAQSGPPLGSMPPPPSSSDPAPKENAKPKPTRDRKTTTRPKSTEDTTSSDGTAVARPKRTGTAATTYDRPSRYVPEEFDNGSSNDGGRAKPFLSESGRPGMGMRF